TGRKFWQAESYDHWVRDDAERERIAAYIENNPVRAGLVDCPANYKWSSAGKSVETSLDAAGTSAQCHLVFGRRANRNIPDELCFGMVASKLSVLLSLYTEIAVGGLFRLLQRNLGLRVHDRIYTPRLLLWMMIQQPLD